MLLSIYIYYCETKSRHNLDCSFFGKWQTFHSQTAQKPRLSEKKGKEETYSQNKFDCHVVDVISVHVVNYGG